MPVTAIALSSSLHEGGARGIHSSDVMEVDVNNQPTIVDVQTPDRSLNLHQNQTSEAQSESPPVEATVEGNITSSRDTSPKLSSDTKETGEGDAIIATRKTSLQTSAERVIAYEKMISQRDKEILILRTNANLLREKVTLLENSSQARTDNTNSMHMREVELEFMHQENDRVRQGAIKENARLSTEVDTLKKDITVLQERMASERGDMEAQLVSEKSRNIALSEKLADAALVSERTMLAYDTQRDLLNAKQEIIDNLRKESEITTQSRVPVLVGQAVRETGTMTSNTEPALEENDMVPRSKLVDLTKHYDGKIKIMSDDMELVKSELKEANDKLVAHDNQAAASKNGVKECCDGRGTDEACEFIKIHATNGVIINGFLLWANIQRTTRTENAWKDDALLKFLKEEITEAKECLWRISGDKIPTPLKKRQGSSKSKSEINDISGALKLLAEKECLPMFLATSDIVKETPVYMGGNSENEHEKEMKSKLKDIETSVKGLLEDKNVTPGVSTSTSQGKHDQPRTTISWAAEEDVKIGSSGEEISDGEDWKVAGGKKPRNKRNAWKDKLNIVKGTAGVDSSTDVPQSADVHLVAYGFGTDTSCEMLKDWLHSNGLRVKSCVLLTKFEGARSLTYKIIVKACDYEKATNPNIWPENIGVRKFKFFTGANKNNRNRTSETTKKARSNSVGDDGTPNNRIFNPVSDQVLAEFINKYQRLPDDTVRNQGNFENQYGASSNTRQQQGVSASALRTPGIYQDLGIGNFAPERINTDRFSQGGNRSVSNQRHLTGGSAPVLRYGNHSNNGQNMGNVHHVDVQQLGSQWATGFDGGMQGGGYMM